MATLISEGQSGSISQKVGFQKTTGGTNAWKHIGKRPSCCLRAVQCFLWALQCFLLAVQCFLRAVQCFLWALQCFLLAVQCFLRAVQCFLWAVQCFLWALQCFLFTGSLGCLPALQHNPIVNPAVPCTLSPHHTYSGL
ncbi:hypothetical protein JZ751_009160 [Albula glossodonta]|uniref:Uncharacterized protein n=1 Tax=Albula glossodonta TaxID=121402 RepID=A0A8T2N8F7_9TELE|nr:hypothetical protein JZ751_009160 [Albula glossodonta]